MPDRPRREPDWLGVGDALERILAAVRPVAAETVPLGEALGRTLAAPVATPVDHPPWDNSAMDGFAVRAADVRDASRAAPVTLAVVDDIAAGRFPARPIGPGEAARIMTGAPVPEGADSVVRIEHTDAWAPANADARERTARAGRAEPAADAPSAGATPERADAGGGGRGAGGAPSHVRIFHDDDALHNVRRRGEDLRAGTVVLEPGRVLRAAEIGVLAAVGRASVRVYRRPRIAILSNGDELVDLEDFDEVRAGRRIVNSNGYALAAAVRSAGCEPVPLGIARDDDDDLRRHLERATGADALVTTAGASVGAHDRVKDVLEAMGFTLDFWRVRMRPGSPFSFGWLDRLPVFGLPGNPVSALVTFEVLVRPALRRMLGRRAVHNPTITVSAAEPIPGADRSTHFPRARIEPDGAGGVRARLTGPQGSGILTSMAEADALLVVPAGVATVPAGQSVTAIPLPALDPAQPNPAQPAGTT
ncbi:MAG TPA: gephyrin-like molybdotransferase Glp [Longimicrobiales bacterium]